MMHPALARVILYTAVEREFERGSQGSGGGGVFVVLLNRWVRG